MPTRTVSIPLAPVVIIAPLAGPRSGPGSVRCNYHGTGRWHVVSRSGVWSIASWPTCALARSAARRVSHVTFDGTMYPPHAAGIAD